MLTSRGPDGSTAKGWMLSACFGLLLAPALFLSSGPASADEQFSISQTVTVSSTPLNSFDISFVDPVIRKYLLADRSNNAIDVLDLANNNSLSQIGKGQFVGVKAVNGTVNNDLSGPNGVMTVHHNQVWAGDGDSTVKIFDISSGLLVNTINTGGQLRADEMAWDPRNNVAVVANPAEDPNPWITLFSTPTDGSQAKILKKIVFDGTNGTPVGTSAGGIEQPSWSPKTGHFYIAVPQIGNPPTPTGAVVELDPKSMSVVRFFTVDNCQPNGTAIGPDFQLYLGCSQTTSPVRTVIVDIRDGHEVASFPVGGCDEVWFNPGDGHYFGACGSNPTEQGGPAVGIIDSDVPGKGPQLDQVFATQPVSGNPHSVAADPIKNTAFVPLPGNDPLCPTSSGCIALLSTQHDDPHMAIQKGIGGLHLGNLFKQ